MKRLIIVCEGQTEQEFCKDVLYSHFLERGIYLSWPTIKKSGGGMVSWSSIQLQIEQHLRENSTAVSTLFDFYGLNPKHDFPGWEAASTLELKEKLSFLETAMQAAIRPHTHRFIPYLQLHEFEGLLFCSIEAFDTLFEQTELLDRQRLVDIIQQYPNPELINEGRDTAPSKRLQRMIDRYDKVTFGSLLAQEIGLATIRARCPRFNAWLTRLESI